jgi:hypothetical protein
LRPCVEHLDIKTWTTKTLIGHYHVDHGGAYITARTTKKGLHESHLESHRLRTEHEQILKERAGVIDYLRSTFGCRLDDDGFACADDAWVADHVHNHETGNTLGGMLL